MQDSGPAGFRCCAGNHPAYYKNFAYPPLFKYSFIPGSLFLFHLGFEGGEGLLPRNSGRCRHTVVGFQWEYIWGKVATRHINVV